MGGMPGPMGGMPGPMGGMPGPMGGMPGPMGGMPGPMGGMPGPMGGMPGPMGGMPGMGGGLGPPGGLGGGNAHGTPEEQAKALINFRYIDEKGTALPGDIAAPNYAKHPFAEFKIMPISMKLMMDQRELPKLLVQCANSTMPIEVRRIRLRPSSNGSGGGYNPAPTGPGFGGAQDPSTLNFGSNDWPVEIHAAIYIYNPPDRQKLGTGTASVKAATPGLPAAPSTALPVTPARPAVTPPPKSGTATTPKTPVPVPVPAPVPPKK
jgi:hypothetical protein